jgi:hypothetical protein
MEKATAEKVLCKTCGADIREGAQFCYGCGRAVAESLPNFEIPMPDGAIDDPTATISTSAGSIPIPRPEGGPADAVREISEASKTVSRNGVGMRTAANLRRAPKSVDREPTEVVWVEPARPPRTFFVVSLALCLLALLLIVAALYLR